MKRDVDLMRELLRYVEAHDVGVGIEIKHYTAAEVLHHLYLLEDAGFIKGVMTFQHTAPVCVCITWNGYEFLETSRSDAIWEKAKRMVADRTGGDSVEVLRPVLLQLSKKTIATVSPLVHQNGRG